MDVANGVVTATELAAVVMALLIIFLALLAHSRRVAAAAASAVAVPPGPRAYPVIGSLHAMHGHGDRPFRRFAELADEYGPVYSMTMGSMPCVIVNDFPSIKEVLITKGSKFGGRPNFERYNALFAGDRNNSLALCDWSSLQETRRRIARKYCSPKVCSSNYALLDSIASEELEMFLNSLATAVGTGASDQGRQVKSLLLMACANMFFRFMCSTHFKYEDPDFQTLVRTFDEIFWNINHGYAVDFLPWLRPFYWGLMRNLSNWSACIRNFMMKNIVSPRSSDCDQWNDDDYSPKDFLEALLISLSNEKELTMEYVLFELEDFIGGHTAVGNMVMIALIAVALVQPEVVETVRKEIEQVTNNERSVRLYDKPSMPYTEAVQYESMRTVSSPIVPHVATEDTTIRGFKIPKGTCIILNNFKLNTSSEYWNDPDKFDPHRYIKYKPDGTGYFQKPEHFIPFGTGKRTCIGQQLVIGFGFVLIAGILQKYNVRVANQTVMPEACLALPPDSVALILEPRNGFK